MSEPVLQPLPTSEITSSSPSALDWIRRRIFTVGRPLVVAADWLVVFGMFQLVYQIRFVWRLWAAVELAPPRAPYQVATSVVATVLVSVLGALGLYRIRRLASRFDDTVILVTGLALGALVALGLGFFYRGFSYSRLVFVTSLGASFIALWLGHLSLRWIQDRLHALGWGTLNVVIVGCNSLGQLMAERFRRAPQMGYRVVGFVPSPGEWIEGDSWLTTIRTGELRETPRAECGPLLGDFGQLPAILSRIPLDMLVVARPGASLSTLFETIAASGVGPEVTIRIVPDLLELMTAKIRMVELDGVPTLELGEVPLRQWTNRFLKRTMDITLSAIGLLLTSPVMLVAGALVKLTSAGPMLYRQERMGRDGRLFNIYKFRSMRIDAEDTTGPVWATPGDARVTPVGQFLRRTSIDELPQLWNVLVGDMSLVGPRPERPHFIEQFRQHVPKYMDRHLVRSGLTGWAQANGLRGEEGTIEERTRYDIYYIENWSLLFDLRIIFKTALEVLGHRAY